MHRLSVVNPGRGAEDERENRAYTTSALTEMVLHSCLIARDAAFNLGNLLSSASGMAVLAIKECEQDLDRYEHIIDENMPVAITQVDEAHARQLLTCLKFITDLERIGDLVASVAQAAQRCHPKLSRRDADPLVRMAQGLEKMLETTHQAFVSRDPRLAESVMKADRGLDDIRRAIFRKHLQRPAGDATRTIHVLFMAQALERAGDHVKNLGEELVSLFARRSMRHTSPERSRRSNITD